MKLIDYLENIDKIKTPVLSDGESETIDNFFNNCIRKLLPSHDTIYAWDKLLNKYVNEDEVIFFIRKYNSEPNNNWENLRRGFYTKYNNNFGYVFCDNFFAHYFYSMAINNYIPEYSDFYQTIMNRNFPYGFMETSEEKSFRAFHRGKTVGINKAGWKLAHILSVNGNDYNLDYKQEAKVLFPIGEQQDWREHNSSTYPYREINREISIKERNIMKAHFLRLVHPINYFLVPKSKYIVGCNNNIGEYPELIQYIYLYNKKNYPDIFAQYEMNTMYKKSESLKTIEELGNIKINIKYGFTSKSTNDIITKEETMNYNPDIVNNYRNLYKSINYKEEVINFKKNDNELFQDFVKRVLSFMFNHSLLSKEEIVYLQSKEYSKKVFGLSRPLLEKDRSKTKDDEGHLRYWQKIKFGGEYYACSQWWRSNLDMYEPLFADWMNYIFENHFKEKYKDMVKDGVPTPNIKVLETKPKESKPIHIESSSEYDFKKWMVRKEEIKPTTARSYANAIKSNEGQKEESTWGKSQNYKQEHNTKTTNSILIEKISNSERNERKQELNQNDKHEILYKAFNFILPVLSVYIGNILHERAPDIWWQRYVLNELPINTVKDLPKNGTYNEYINNLDISLCLKIIMSNWVDIFKNIMRNIQFSWVHELIGIRNDISHWSIEKSNNYTFDDISHTLNVMRLFMRPIDTNVAEQISKIKREFENKYKNEN